MPTPAFCTIFRVFLAFMREQGVHNCTTTFLSGRVAELQTFSSSTKTTVQQSEMRIKYREP